MRASVWVAWAAALLLAGTAQAAGPGVPEPAGYRMDGYRSPTPATVAGAVTVDTVTARRLLDEGKVIFINVLRAERSSVGGQWLLPKPEPQIPGGVWLPNVGVGEPGAEYEAYFSRNLDRLTGGDRERGLLIYCRSDCWLSWNAAKRAAALGYRRIYWYRDGIDAWMEAGLPTQDGAPVPIQ